MTNIIDDDSFVDQAEKTLKMNFSSKDKMVFAEKNRHFTNYFQSTKSNYVALSEK